MDHPLHADDYKINHQYYTNAISVIKGNVAAPLFEFPAVFSAASPFKVRLTPNASAAADLTQTPLPVLRNRASLRLSVNLTYKSKGATVQMVL